MINLKIASVLVMLAFLGLYGIRESGEDPCQLDSQVRPIKLMADELSYSPFEKYAKLFSDPSFRWIERSTNLDRDGHSIDRFELKGMFLGHSGKIEYVFYFRRLAEMRFHPDNASDFFQAARNQGLPASDGQRLVKGDLEYWAIRAPGPVDFFGVADSRITDKSVACTAATD